MLTCSLFIFVYVFVLLNNSSFLSKMATVEERLRDALNRHVTELNNYRQLYIKSQRENDRLKDTCHRLQLENGDLETQVFQYEERLGNLQNQIEDLKRDLNLYKVPKFRKKYQDLKCRSQRCLRNKSYKVVLKRLFKTFPDVISANVNMNMGCKWVQFPFSYQDLNPNIDQNDENNSSEGVQNSQQPNDVDMEDADSDLNSDCDRLNILTRGGKISKRHIRSMIYIMDKFKIAIPAYHELRMSCNGILPSINIIRKHRLEMSQEIPYMLDAYVSNSPLNLTIFYLTLEAMI